MAESLPYLIPFGIQFLASQSQQSGAKQQSQQYGDYLNQLKEIYSRENIYSPAQLAAQDQLFPMWAGFTGQALGHPLNWNYGQGKTNNNQPTVPFSASTIPSQGRPTGIVGGSTGGYNPPAGIVTMQMSNPNRYLGYEGGYVDPESNPGASIWDANYYQTHAFGTPVNTPVNTPDQTSFYDPKAAEQQGADYYNFLKQWTESNLAKSRGATQSVMDTNLRTAQQDLLGQNRALFGNASSGHVAGQLGDLEKAYMMAKPQLQETYNNKLMDWQAQQAQYGLNALQSAAFGQPMGNLPYPNIPTEPPAPWVNMTMPSILNSLGNMYLMNQVLGGNQNQTSPWVIPSISWLSGLR